MQAPVGVGDGETGQAVERLVMLLRLKAGVVVRSAKSGSVEKTNFRVVEAAYPVCQI